MPPLFFMNIHKTIQDLLAQSGFLAAGITRSDAPPHFDVYRDWIARGNHAEMAYLANSRALERRAQPDLILPGRGAVIVAALPYSAPQPEPGQPDASPLGRIASYAWGLDYHDIIPQKLNHLADQLRGLLGSEVHSRAYTDTGPIMERDFAQRAGLGWIGKNTCLIVPGIGSFVLLGELFVEADLEPDLPFSADRCGSCRRCIEACPTDCIAEDRTLDARRCISYLTIENKNAIPMDLREPIQDWVFGCDVCQQVCPWNIRFAHGVSDPALAQLPEIQSPDLLTELAMTPQDFNRKFKFSPVLRAKRRGYLRNVAVALGNSATSDAVPALILCLDSEPEAMVRAHAAWALGRLAGPHARAALEKALSRESNPDVLNEIQSALVSG